MYFRWLWIAGAGLFITLSASGSAQDKAMSVPLKRLGQNTATFVYVNGTKYQLLERNLQYWLLMDIQNFNMLYLTNQLIVVGAGSEQALTQRLKQPVRVRAKLIAPAVLVFTGSIAELRQLEQDLQRFDDLKTEWKLQYLPLRSQADR